MTIDKKVVNAFVFICKAGKSTRFTKAWELFIASGQKFMSITLMAYIPDNGIIRTVENTMQSDCKFNNTKITCKMTAVFSNDIYNSCTDFLSELLKFFLRKLFDVLWRMYF